MPCNDGISILQRVKFTKYIEHESEAIAVCSVQLMNQSWTNANVAYVIATSNWERFVQYGEYELSISITNALSRLMSKCFWSSCFEYYPFRRVSKQSSSRLRGAQCNADEAKCKCHMRMWTGQDDPTTNSRWTPTEWMPMMKCELGNAVNFHLQGSWMVIGIWIKWILSLTIAEEE